MKNKKFLFAFSLFNVLSLLAGCNDDPNRIISDTSVDPIVRANEVGETITINDPNDPANSQLKSVDLSTKMMCLYANSENPSLNESRKIEFNVTPFGSNTSMLTFVSSNPAVATVDQNGVVKAKSEGFAEITFGNADGSIKDTCHVVVNNDIPASLTTMRKNEIKTAQNSINVDNLYVIENYSDQTYTVSDEVVRSTNKFTQKMWASKANAYFRITSDEFNEKCNGGSPEQSRVDYIFYTDNLYFTYAIKTDGEKKNYMRVDQTSFRKAGKSQYEALLEVLNNFFTSGKKIITDQFDNIKNLKDLNTKSSQQHAGFIENNSGQLSFEYSQAGSEQVDSTNEDDYPGIDVGTEIGIEVSVRNLWEDNLCSNRHIVQKLSYNQDDIDYVNEFNVDYYYYQVEKKDLFKPNLSAYKKVDDIFSL